MGKTTKKWLVTAVSLILVGCIIIAGVMAMLNWDFSKLSTATYETNRHHIQESFRNISINADTADVTIALSDDETCKVTCYEEEKAKHAVFVRDDTLTIQLNNQKAWYDYIGIHVGSPSITVHLPQTAYASLVMKGSTGNVRIPTDFQFESADITLSTGHVTLLASTSALAKVKTNTGNIHVENTVAGVLELAVSTGTITVSNVACTGDAVLSVTTGKTTLNNMTCQNLTSGGDTGSILLKNVVAAETFSIKRSTGNVTFDSADATAISVITDTGDVTGHLLTSKVFVVHTDTGRIRVPKTAVGGTCEVTTDTGDVLLDIL